MRRGRASKEAGYSASNTNSRVPSFFGNRVAVVSKDQLSAFRRALKQLGFVMPAGK